MGTSMRSLVLGLFLALACFGEAVLPNTPPAVVGPEYHQPAATAPHGTDIKLSLSGKVVSLYLVKSNAAHVCREVGVDANYVPVVKHFLQYRVGKCSEHGFALVDGKEDVKMPRIGQVRVKKFRDKPEM